MSFYQIWWEMFFTYKTVISSSVFNTTHTTHAKCPRHGKILKYQLLWLLKIKRKNCFLGLLITTLVSHLFSGYQFWEPIFFPLTNSESQLFFRSPVLRSNFFSGYQFWGPFFFPVTMFEGHLFFRLPILTIIINWSKIWLLKKIKLSGIKDHWSHDQW